MIIADLKGKLSQMEHVSEDFLTSTVFSTFDLLSCKWFSQFLNTATNMDGESLKINVSNFKLLFWKSFSDPYGVEPDVLILLDNIIIIVEAKFYSGKSGIGTSEDNSILYDQLAREYLLGSYLTTSKTVLDETFSSFKDFMLLYVTKDSSFPTMDIIDSIQTLKKYDICANVSTKKIYWVNWQSIYNIFINIPQNLLKNYEKKLLKQLLPFLEKRNLINFNGFAFLNDYKKGFGVIKRESLFYSPLNVNNSYWISKVYTNEIQNISILFYDAHTKYWNDPLFAKELDFNKSHLYYGRRRKYWQSEVFQLTTTKDPLVINNR